MQVVKNEQTARERGDAAGGNALPQTSARRRRLRMQPLATDNFSTFVYACIALLLLGEFVSLFWLDLFG